MMGERIRPAFGAIDKDGSGTLTEAEFAEVWEVIRRMREAAKSTGQP